MCVKLPRQQTRQRSFPVLGTFPHSYRCRRCSQSSEQGCCLVGVCACSVEVCTGGTQALTSCHSAWIACVGAIAPWAEWIEHSYMGPAICRGVAVAQAHRSQADIFSHWPGSAGIIGGSPWQVAPQDPDIPTSAGCTVVCFGSVLLSLLKEI